MSEIDRLEAVKRQLQSDIAAIDRVIAILKNPDAGVAKQENPAIEPGLFENVGGQWPGLACAMRFAVVGMDGSPFTVEDIRRYIQAAYPDQTYNTNSLYGALHKMKVQKEIEVMRKKRGRLAAKYVKGSNFRDPTTE